MGSKSLIEIVDKRLLHLFLLNHLAYFGSELFILDVGQGLLELIIEIGSIVGDVRRDNPINLLRHLLEPPFVDLAERLIKRSDKGSHLSNLRVPLGE